MSNRFVLDSFALISYLRSEASYHKIVELLRRSKASEVHLYLSIINYGEVLYIIERLGGIEAAKKTVSIIDFLPIEVVVADRSLTFLAAHIKANYRLSYADAFAVALAMEKQATLVTGDPKFRSLEQRLRIEWLV